MVDPDFTHDHLGRIASASNPLEPRSEIRTKLKSSQGSVLESRKRAPLSKRSIDTTTTPISPVWIDVEEHNITRPRIKPRRTSEGTNPHRTSSSVHRVLASELGNPGKEALTQGFLPKLSQLLESREDSPARYQAGPLNGGAHQNTQSGPRRNHRNTENVSTQRAKRSGDGYLQRRGGLLNSSTLSLLSSITKSSAKSERSKERQRRSSDTSDTMGKKNKKGKANRKKGPLNVVDIKDEEQELPQETRPESPSSEQDTPESPQDRFVDSGISVRGSSPDPSEHTQGSDKQSVAHTSEQEEETEQEEELSELEGEVPEQDEEVQGHDEEVHVEDYQVHEEEEEEDGPEEDEDQVLEQGEEQEPEDEEEEDEDDDGIGHDNVSSPHDYHGLALDRLRPLSIPSSPRGRSPGDAEDQRLRNRLHEREQQLRHHVLHSPQPQRSPGAYENNYPGPPPSAPPFDPEMQYSMPPGYFYQPPPPMSTAGGYLAPAMSPQTQLQPVYPNQVASPSHGYEAAPPTHGYDTSRTTVTGYELLAAKLSDCTDTRHGSSVGIRPMYRKFEKLNHRVLLHLQDEIAELEEELRSLDECVAQMAENTGAGRTQPASRRMDARYGSEWHFRRTELLGKIFMKLNQYNQALTSYNGVSTCLEPAAIDSIRAYKKWIERNACIDKSETQFLDHKKDLLSMKAFSLQDTVPSVPLATPTPSTLSTPSTSEKSVRMCFTLTLLLPLLVFAFVPSVIGRLLVLTVISAVEVAIVSSTELLQLLSTSEWMTCGGVYFAVMAVVAGSFQ
ncbi:hypothetical protein M501DRAFT_322910 [Patellaria atrata CBS 101060]|uniref:DUF6594 domain-containing protein n=1 Tax=Patellaria atrata CBS 101060 TaxID=1346257 RepID=A0A9P4S4H6_9PEZI|nr:hypothetical protein M501DRAFT_322910 [Patellaria atrata CBS 101060]